MCLRYSSGVWGCFCYIDQLLFLSTSSCCQCYHSRGYLFIWNVRLRGERKSSLSCYLLYFLTIIFITSGTVVVAVEFSFVFVFLNHF